MATTIEQVEAMTAEEIKTLVLQRYSRGFRNVKFLNRNRIQFEIVRQTERDTPWIASVSGPVEHSQLQNVALWFYLSSLVAPWTDEDEAEAQAARSSFELKKRTKSILDRADTPAHWTRLTALQKAEALTYYRKLMALRSSSAFSEDFNSIEWPEVPAFLDRSLYYNSSSREFEERYFNYEDRSDYHLFSEGSIPRHPHEETVICVSQPVKRGDLLVFTGATDPHLRSHCAVPALSLIHI